MADPEIVQVKIDEEETIIIKVDNFDEDKHKFLYTTSMVGITAIDVIGGKVVLQRAFFRSTDNIVAIVIDKTTMDNLTTKIIRVGPDTSILEIPGEKQ